MLFPLFMAATLSLAGEWALSGEGADGRFVACGIRVPGDVHSALCAAGVIPDTFVGTNELAAAWVNRKKWTLSRSFVVDGSILSAKSVVLRLEDVDTFATILVNGECVGETCNRFRRWEFDIKPYLRDGTNTLTGVFRPAWDVSEAEAARYPRPIPCAPNGIVPTINYIRKPQCHGGWDWGITQMTVGFCGAVELIATDDFRIDYIHSDVQLTGDLSEADVRVFVELTDADGTRGVVTNDFTLANPNLWWPRGMGEQKMSSLMLNVRGRQVPHRLAIRSVELVNRPDEDVLTGEKGLSCFFRINGRDVFAKGANWIPCDAYDVRQTPERYRDLLESAAAANMNMIRVWGGGLYEKDVFYELCDELGLMVWQDFMFACGNYPDGAFLDNVRAEVEHQVKRLKDYGCIVLWAGDNECRSVWRSGSQAVKLDPEHYYGMYRARTKMLDEIVGRLDPGRTFWPSSPCDGPDDDMRGRSSSARGDTHYWGVWHGGLPFRAFGEVHPRFCSEFGFQSYPSREVCDTFLPPGEDSLDSAVFNHHQKNGGGNERIRRTLDRYFGQPKDFDASLYLSQVQQAMAVRTGVEMWRAEKPWCMGTLIWQLNDNWPVSSWSSIEYGGKWKHLHYHARRFFDDVAVLPIENAWNDGMYILAVVNDTDRDVTDDLVMERWDFDGKAPLPHPNEDQVCPCRRVTVPAGQVRRFGLWWGNVGFSTFRFGKASNYWVSAPYKDCPLAPAKITVDVKDVSRENVSAFAVRLSTDYPAFFVWADVKGVRGEFDDNSILLLPNAPRTLTFTPKGNVSVDAFRRALSVRHLQQSMKARPSDSSLRQGDRVVILGDSLTNQGLAVISGDQIGYYHRLTNALSRVHGPDFVSVIPLGYSGWHVPSWIETERQTRTAGFRRDASGKIWDAKEVLDAGAEIAVFFLGMNDLVKPVVADAAESLAAWKEKYRSLIRTVKARIGAREVVLVTVTPLTCDMQSRKNVVRAKLNATIRALAAEEEARVVEAGEFVENLCDETCWQWKGCAVGDKIHPNWRTGHAALALAFAKGLGESMAARLLSDEYAEALANCRAKFGPLVLRQSAVLPMDPSSTTFDYRIDWLSAAKDVAQVEPVLPTGWSLVRAECLAADRGSFIVRGCPDVAATKILVRMRDVNGRTLTQEISIPPPWRVSLNGGDERLVSSSWHYRGWGQAGEIDPFQVFHGTTDDSLTVSRQYVSDRARLVDLVFSTRDYAKRLDLELTFNGTDLGRVVLSPDEKKIKRRVELRAGSNELVFTARIVSNQRQITCDLKGLSGDNLEDVRYGWKGSK